ncbi:MAG TPA: sigma-70 family RNA polymerase sigma factor [Gemmataceae bacterium]|jgi:RNA polymerase sigma factor (sigma-70 family)|nr:sigma-70 family RNA polymerase sigma factor [Gemmataceae bacterium]
MANAQLDQVLHFLHGLCERDALTQATDAQLLEAFLTEREEASFSLLVHRHGGMVLSVAVRVLGNRADAEDVFQATFLLLARKGMGIRKRQSVGSWLHGVAYRLAHKARLQRSRRQNHEKRAAIKRTATVNREAAWQEVQAALDTALQELPECYRTLLVQCYLEGKSHAEAAEQLGCPLGTVRTRIARGRRLLRARLMAKGLTLTTSGLTALLLSSIGPPSAPAALVQLTLRAAGSFASGQTPLTGVAEPVARLVEEGLKTMSVSKTKIALLFLVALGVVSGGGLLARQRRGANDTPTIPAFATQTEEPRPDRKVARRAQDKDAVTYSGRVIDTEGHPVANADVKYLFVTREEEPTPVRAVTNTRGQFQFTLTKKDVPLSAEAMDADPLKMGQLFVSAPSFALGWRGSRSEKQETITVQLTRDVTPIKGRLVDLQGKPLAGLNISTVSVWAPEKGDLTPFIQALSAGGSFYTSAFKHVPNAFTAWIIGQDVSRFLPSTITDAGGRFQLTGLARETIVELRIEGAAVETQRFYVINRPRPGSAARLLAARKKPSKDPEDYEEPPACIFWNDFDHALAPGLVVAGTLREQDSGRPLADAVVESYRLAESRLVQDATYHTVTDSQGRYRLIGLPRGHGNQLRFRPPAGSPYFPVVKDVPPTKPYMAANLDILVQRGILVNVQAHDKTSGEPVPGCVSYFILPEKLGTAFDFTRPHADAYNDFMPIRNDGTFRFVALPGRAILAFRTSWRKYPIAKEAPAIQLPSALCPSNFQAFLQINPKADDEPLRVQFALDAEHVAKGKLRDPDGKPLVGALVAGLRHDWYTDTESPLASDEFTALGLDPGQPRLLCFAHPQRKLAGSVVVRGDEKEPIVAKLESWATVSGRLLTADGKPVQKAALWFTQMPPLKPGAARSTDTGIHVVYRSGYRPSPDPRTDAQGNFRVEGLVPGLKYNLALPERDAAPQQKWKGVVFRNLVLKSGENKDLGSITLQPFPKQ